MPVRLYRQYGSGLGLGGDGRLLPGIVYYHGGGWVTGDLDTHDASCRLLAAVARCLVVAVDYRLAPEDPFPAAVDDALAAYAWVQRHADELGIDPRQVGVMGDSAGGNLAAVVALETRAGGSVAADDVPPPVAQGLIYPVVDARLDTDSVRTLGEGFFLTRRPWSSSASSTCPTPRTGPGAGPRRCWPTTTGAWPRPWWSRRVSTPSGTTGPNYAEALPGRRSRGRVPVLRRPGPRVHGHGHPARLAGPGHRGLRRHGSADAPSVGRRRGRRA